MQQSTEPASPSFAGLLAALAAPGQGSWAPAAKPASPPRSNAPAWNDDDLAEDVATLSYERALRTHARYRATDQSLTQLNDLPPNLLSELPDFDFEETSPATKAPAPEAPFADYAKTAAASHSDRYATPLEKNLKQASVTIRMSRSECVQLHRRAAEAGLTVSAYLRSCTFEAESLRAMVKDTLAQLRAVTPADEPAHTPTPDPTRRRRVADWLTHLLTPWQSRQREARA
jgi:hypothetical protein